MADDTLLNPGSGGDLLATESLGGTPERKMARGKLVIGAKGTDDGDVHAGNPLPVTFGAADLIRDYVNAGSNIYSNIAGDFVATPNNNTKTITLSSYANSILSASITAKNFMVAQIKRLKVDGSVESLPTTNLAFAANVITLADMTGNLLSSDVVIVVLFGPDKGYDEINDATKTTNISPGLATIDSITAKLSAEHIMVNEVELTPKFAKVAAASNGDNTIVAAVTSKKIRVLGGKLSFSGTVNAKWQSGASGTDLTGLTYGVANVVDNLPFNPVGHFETASGILLNLNLSGAVAVGGYVVYVEV